MVVLFFPIDIALFVFYSLDACRVDCAYSLNLVNVFFSGLACTRVPSGSVNGCFGTL